MKLHFYHIRESYISFLRLYDEKVPQNKVESRPYIGVVLDVDGVKYYAPLSSPKPKHKRMKTSLDFIRIRGGKLGCINLNNMIPVTEENLIKFDINKIENQKYKDLLIDQLLCINEIQKKIFKNAYNLRKLCITDDVFLNKDQINIKKRCCNIKLLEQIFRKQQKRG